MKRSRPPSKPASPPRTPRPRPPSIPPGGRDQDPTSFADILQDLLWLEPRAIAAVLIDGEGETVDYASSLPSFFTRVAGANLRVVLDDIGAAWTKLGSGGLTEALVRARHRSFFARTLPDGYALVLVLRRRVFTVSTRAVALATCRLSKEAGWPAPAEASLPWHAAEIETRPTDRFRPLQMKVGDAWEHIEVLGSVVGLARDSGERGYRCRLQGGAEVTLVRESTGIWFVDQPSRGLSSRHGPDGESPASPRTSGAPSSPASRASGAPTTSRPSRTPAPSTSAPRSREPPASPEVVAPEPKTSEPTKARSATLHSDVAPSGGPTYVGTSDERGDMWAKEAKRAK